MPKALTDNVEGHRMKYDHLIKHLPIEDVQRHFVGSSDPVMTGYMELELIRHLSSTKDASVVDIGCGIGRLTRHLLHEPIRQYLGTDIIPEIMGVAEEIAAGRENYRFAIGEDCQIPLGDGEADIVLAFSVITHLMDEEVFEYVSEARRVLSAGGVAIISFLDFNHPGQRATFFAHARQHRHGHGDILKFTTTDVLEAFAQEVGFATVEFMDGSAPIPNSGKGSPLVPPSEIPEAVFPGQSVCVMRA